MWRGVTYYEWSALTPGTIIIYQQEFPLRAMCSLNHKVISVHGSYYYERTWEGPVQNRHLNHLDTPPWLLYSEYLFPYLICNSLCKCRPCNSTRQDSGAELCSMIVGPHSPPQIVCHGDGMATKKWCLLSLATSGSLFTKSWVWESSTAAALRRTSPGQHNRLDPGKGV